MSKKIIFKVLLLAMVYSMVMPSCKRGAKDRFEVTCTYQNASKAFPAAHTKVYLEKLDGGKDQQPLVMDSGSLAADNGSFTVSARIKPGEQDVYELVFGDNVLAIPMINDGESATLRVDLAKKDNFYSVSGSDATASLKDLIDTLGKKNFLVDRNFTALDSLKKTGAPDSLVLAQTERKNRALTDLNDYLKGFIHSSVNPTLGTLALGWASRSFTQNDFESELDGLLKKFPSYKVLLDMKKSYDAQKAQLAQMQQQQQQGNSWVNKQAPDFSLPDANGKAVSLASFKGKYLLVDFWASWCGPCRAENPNVVKAYQEYKDKNFAILGVSLDQEKSAWQQAILADRLAWTQVSDLKGWNNAAAALYSVQAIPFNILVDPEGKIIAQELRGGELENKLKEVLQ